MRTLLFLLCLNLSAAAVAQEYSYAHYDVRDGLPGAIVYTLVQDHDGFMWFGTEAGLSRFDGKTFTNFTTSDGLPDNDVIRLFVDSKNRVWVLPFKNAVCYYWHGKIYTAENDSLLKKIHLDGNVIGFVENGRGEIALLEGRKITVIKAGNEVVTIDHYRNTKIHAAGIAGLTSKGSFQFILVFGKLQRDYFELQGDTLVKIKSLEWANAINKMRLTRSYLYEDLEILCELDSVHFYLPSLNRHYTIAAPRGLIEINKLNDSLISINSSSAVQFYNYIEQKPGKIFFRDKNISNVLQDAEGCIWFTSLGEGVFRLPSPEFKAYSFTLNGNTLPVFSIKKTGDSLYAGTDHFRLWSINTKTNITREHKLIDAISIGRVLTIDTLRGWGVLAGTDVGLFTVTPKRTRWITYGHSIKAIQYLKDSVLLGVEGGAFTIGKNRLSHIMTSGLIQVNVDGALVWNGRVTTIYRKQDTTYVGTLNGLYRVTATETYALKELHEALGNRIATIKESADGSLWIATNGDGIVRFKNGQVVKVLNDRNGLSSPICRAVFIVDSILWVGTDKGLNRVRFSDTGYSITRFSAADGLIANSINAIYVDRDIVYVGTPAGITYFNEKTETANSTCVIRLTGIQSGRRQWNYDTTGLLFDHYDNSIRFSYAGISYKSAAEVTYRYRLMGLDENWRTTQDNFINYSGLQSGQYALQVVAINKFGVASNVLVVEFSIKQLLWETTWFRILAVLFIGGLLWIFVNRRIKRIRKEEAARAETNRKIAELEQMALRAQMNPHFIFNSLNSIQQYVIDKDTKGANKFITDFSRLVRLTLDLSSRQWITLAEEINYISTYLELEKERFEGKFRYEVDWSGVPELSSAFIPSMILQPYIENSIRHGVRYREDNNGVISIRFSTNNNFLYCIIEDNGVGRRESKRFGGKQAIEYQSKGMALTARRIEALNKHLEQPIHYSVEDLYEQDDQPCGTRVVLQFPLRKTL